MVDFHRETGSSVGREGKKENLTLESAHSALVLQYVPDRCKNLKATSTRPSEGFESNEKSKKGITLLNM